MIVQAASDAKIIGIDYVPELVDFATKNMKKSNKDLLDSGKVELKGSWYHHSS
jgi:hypothetical protein